MIHYIKNDTSSDGIDIWCKRNNSHGWYVFKGKLDEFMIAYNGIITLQNGIHIEGDFKN